VLVEAPIVTMRISGLKGKPTREASRDPSIRSARWALNHEYRSTYRSQIRPSEKLISGKWVERVAPGTDTVPISVEQGLAASLGVKLGDEIEFDVQGVPVKTKAASLREVDWKRLEPNFFIVFPEGVLEAAPKFFVVAVHTVSTADSARLQRSTVAAYPNVSAIDLTLVFDTLDGIFGKLELVVRALALIKGGTGILVLAGSMLAGKYQRIRESVLLRTLGCTRRQLALIQGSEYAILGILAAILGCGLAAIANALISTYMFKIPAAWPWTTFVVAVGVVGTLTLFAGWYSNRDVVNHPPLAVLRQES
jgi:putative ABC transport system permease protein